MNPAFWTFVASALLLVGLVELWRAPRRRVAHVLHMTHQLRDVSAADLGRVRRLARQLDRFKRFLPMSRMEEMREKLLWAGQPFGLTVEEFLFARLGCGIGAGLAAPALLGVLGFDAAPLAMTVAGAIGYLLPEKLLQLRIEERTRQIQIDLPVFTHLLATALEAGLPMVEAVRRVASEQSGLLAAEMTRTVQEMAAGKSATLAWQHLMRRTNCQELRDVVGAIIQSQELGVGVAEQLRFHLRTVRNRKQQEATDKAKAASVKMKLPTILLIVAPTMIMLLGPAFMEVLRMMSGG